jgi:Domain of unknown function DUF29
MSDDNTDGYAWTQAQAAAIRHARREIADDLAENRSLRGYPTERLSLAYQRARLDAADETDLPLTTFPEVCPWSIAQVLDEDFWPEA